MNDWNPRARSDLNHASYVPGGDDIRLNLRERLDLFFQHAHGQVGLQDVVGAGGAAAEMAVGCFAHLETGFGEQRLGRVMQFWPCCIEQAP